MPLFQERQRRLQFGLFLIFLPFHAGCVSSPRSETAGAASLPTAPVSLAAPADESSAVSKSEADNFAQPPTANATPGARGSGAGSTPARKPAAAGGMTGESKRAAPAPAQPASAPAAERQLESADTEYRNKSATLLQGVLRPTPSDSPELRTALEDFQSATEQLVAPHSCDEGCRAFQSMRRAAARICDLAGTSDATHRCLIARNRVTEADRDIKNRCGQCQ